MGLEVVLVNGTGLEFGAVGVDCRQAGTQDVGNALAVGNANANERQHTRLGRQAFALLDLNFAVFLQQLIYSIDKVRINVEERIIKVLIEQLSIFITQVGTFQLSRQFLDLAVAVQSVKRLALFLSPIDKFA